MGQGTNMYKQILLICIGALISILTTVINKFVDGWLNKRGEVIIYRKRVYQQNSTNRTMEVYVHDNNETLLVVPLWIEIQNTKKTPVIIRDFSLELYKNGDKIKKMKQISHQKNSSLEPEICYGDNGNYSFLIKPESIMRYNLLYSLKKNDCEIDFDEIKIVYYDSKNKKITEKFQTMDSWNLKKYGIDDDWIKLN